MSIKQEFKNVCRLWSSDLGPFLSVDLYVDSSMYCFLFSSITFGCQFLKAAYNVDGLGPSPDWSNLPICYHKKAEHMGYSTTRWPPKQQKENIVWSKYTTYGGWCEWNVPHPCCSFMSSVRIGC